MWRKLAKLYRLLRGTEPCCDRPRGKLCVGFIPWWPGTFYQQRLVQEVVRQGMHVGGRELSVKSLICLLLGRDCDDVIHVHWPHGAYMHNYWQVPFVLFHLALYRLLKDNIVWTVHELEFYETRYPILDRLVVRALMNLARVVVVHSRYSMDLVRRRYGYKKSITVLPHPSFIGCYPNEIQKGAARRNLGLDAGATVYLFLGHIKPYKGVEELIAAFRSIDDGAIRLVIAGKPLDVATADRVRAMALEDRRITTAVDYLPDDRLQVFINAADVLVYPFRRMHTSGSVLLGMSFGRPVVVPVMASLPEDVDKDAGIFFDPRDPRALRAALLACRHKDLAAMGRRAHRSLEGRSWPAFGAEHARLYRSVVLPFGHLSVAPW
jgi:beta-1,4-mannosyltransferase